jgi:hypothetical protein
MSVLSWVRGLLTDPTSPLHLTGFVILYSELWNHLHGHPWDLNASIAAAICFGSGGGIDLVQLYLQKRGLA